MGFFKIYKRSSRKMRGLSKNAETALMSFLVDEYEKREYYIKGGKAFMYHFPRSPLGSLDYDIAATENFRLRLENYFESMNLKYIRDKGAISPSYIQKFNNKYYLYSHQGHLDMYRYKFEGDDDYLIDIIICDPEHVRDVSVMDDDGKLIYEARDVFIRDTFATYGNRKRLEKSSKKVVRTNEDSLIYEFHLEKYNKTKKRIQTIMKEIGGYEELFDLIENSYDEIEDVTNAYFETSDVDIDGLFRELVSHPRESIIDAGKYLKVRKMDIYSWWSDFMNKRYNNEDIYYSREIVQFRGCSSKPFIETDMSDDVRSQMANEDVKYIMMIISVARIDEGGRSLFHSNVILINKTKKQIIRFDSHGINTEVCPQLTVDIPGYSFLPIDNTSCPYFIKPEVIIFGKKKVKVDVNIPSGYIIVDKYETTDPIRVIKVENYKNIKGAIREVANYIDVREENLGWFERRLTEGSLMQSDTRDIYCLMWSLLFITMMTHSVFVNNYELDYAFNEVTRIMSSGDDSYRNIRGFTSNIFTHRPRLSLKPLGSPAPVAKRRRVK